MALHVWPSCGKSCFQLASILQEQQSQQRADYPIKCLQASQLFPLKSTNEVTHLELVILPNRYALEYFNI